jgi:UDP-N-acetylmuramoyl-L-alanyl-D-glutamate--2,6-diaminopimelate ligase
MEFLVSGFTNLSQDHFDYHDNIDTYFDAKKKLFNKNLSKQYVFIDEDWGTRLNKEVNGESWSIGFKKENDMFIKEIKSSESNTLVSFKIDNHDYSVILPFIGPNCEMNYLLAVGMAYFSDTLSIDRILLETVNIKNPKGRFEKFSYLDNDVYVDYAHTPEAIDKAIEVVQEKYEKIIIVFGAGGNRDSYKRVNMGKAANKADQIIITNDNPRKEDPMTIAKEILEGVDLNKKVEIVLDRKAALKKGLDSLLGKSVLLVLGKGHESKQELNEGFVDFDDSVMISNLIKDMK